MGQQHLARLAAPAFWQLARKEHKWTLRPRSGTHALEASLPLGVVIRDMLGLAHTAKELKWILNQGSVLVDKVVRKDPHFAIGFMDVLEFPQLQQTYRVVLDYHGQFVLLPVPAAEMESKLLKVIGKTMLRKKQLQFTLSDGRNLLDPKQKMNVGDTVHFHLGKKAVQEVLPVEPGMLAYFIDGTHQGTLGVVKAILRGKDLQEPKISAEQNGVTFITSLRYVLIVGKQKPLLTLTP